MAKRLILTGAALTIFAGAGSLGGCVGSFGAVREAVANAPDWYDDRRTEVRGEGYPDISRVSGLVAERDGQETVDETRAAVVRAEDLLLLDPRAIPPWLELDKMMIWVEAARAEFDSIDPNSEFLSDEDIQALRAQFTVERAQS